MKLLVTTRADASVADWAALTHPMLMKYAERVNADFMVLDETLNVEEASGGIGNGVYQYRIMKHYDLHEEYDRILHLDNDMLLAPDCPNLFDVVPDDHVGTIYEDVGSRMPWRRQCLAQAQRQFGFIGWDAGYINTGVFVTSRCHREIYRPINGEYFTEWGTDDVHIGYLIKKHGFKVMQLPYQYNHMTMFSEPWNGNPDRFKSHIIHYAGGGVFNKAEAPNKLEQAKLDYRVLYGEKQ